MRLKLLVIITILCMVNVVGCMSPTVSDETSAPSKSTTPQESSSRFNELGTMPIVKEKAEFSVLIPWGRESALEDTWCTTEYEKMTNVHINWQVVPPDGWTEKRNLVLASGNLPDGIAATANFGNAAFTATDVSTYGHQGLFLNILPYIESDSLYLKEYLDANPKVLDYVKDLDGNLYTYPLVNVCYHCNHSQKGWINTEWLKTLGLKMPTTTQEFKDVLMAFKNEDANGNGNPNDEIPFSTVVGGNRSNVDGFLMNAFIYMDSDQRMFFDDNKNLVFAPAQDEFRDGLRYIADLYKNGLIDPASFTQNGKTLQQINESGDRTVVGSTVGGNDYTCCGGVAVSGRWKEYDAIPPLVGPNGVSWTATYNATKPASVGLWVITTAAKDPELMMRWSDWLYSQEGVYFQELGLEGRDWRKAKSGELGINGEPALIVPLVPASELINKNINWGQNFPNIRTAEYRLGVATPSQDWRAGEGDLEVQLYQATKNLYVSHAAPYEMLVPQIQALPADVTNFSLMKSGLTSYVDQSVARFVTGDLSLDKDWDSYIVGLEKLGLSDYLAICQRGYDAKYK